MISENKKYCLTFIFTSPKKFKLFSWIIKTRIGKPYCHVAIVITPSCEDAGGLTEVYQAAHGLVHSMEMDYFLSINNVIKTCHVIGDRDRLVETIKFLKKNSGKNYSELGAIACTFWILRKLKIGIDGDKEFICSEYGMNALEVFLNMDIRPEIANDYITPAQFEAILDSLKTASP